MHPLRKVYCGGTTLFWLRLLSKRHAVVIQRNMRFFLRLKLTLVPILCQARLNLKPVTIAFRVVSSQKAGMKSSNRKSGHKSSSYCPCSMISLSTRLIQIRFIVVAKDTGLTLDAMFDHYLRGFQYGLLIRVQYQLESGFL